LEPAKGLASYGSCAQNWTEEGGKCVPVDHQGYLGRENHVVCPLSSPPFKPTSLTTPFRLQRFKIDVASTVVNQQNAGLGTMETDQILDLFNLGETADGIDKPTLNGGESLGREEDMVDATGEVREKGKRGWLDEIGELWDDKQYEESFDLEGFLKSMK
jgi:hypothetical protein